jgi:hypothetical protein
MKYEDLILLSDPYTVCTKFKKLYPSDSDIRISARKNKKYMIYNTDKGNWFHFGSSDYSDYTKHGDIQRRINFLRRNQKWADANMYTPAFSSYYLLW